MLILRDGSKVIVYNIDSSPRSFVSHEFTNYPWISLPDFTKSNKSATILSNFFLPLYKFFNIHRVFKFSFKNFRKFLCLVFKIIFFFCCARKTRQCTENWKLSFVRRVVLNGIKLEILKYLLHFNYVIIMRERVVQGCKWFTLPDGSRARNITSVKLHPT